MLPLLLKEKNESRTTLRSCLSLRNITTLRDAVSSNGSLERIVAEMNADLRTRCTRMGMLFPFLLTTFLKNEIIF